MEIERSVRQADNRVIALMVLAFIGLVFLTGVALDDTPTEVEATEATFDVAPAPPLSVQAESAASDAQFTRLARPLEPVASRADERWHADESASGVRPDAPR